MRPKRGVPPRQARPARPERQVSKPDFPVGAEPDLPSGVIREIRREAPDAQTADEVALALSLASDALALEDPDTARPYAEWARSVCPGSKTIREAVGVARYQDGDYSGALTELQAYRRMTDKQDQNHVIADCLRALDRDRVRIPELVRAMGDDVEMARRVEGIIVWGASLADEGDVAGGRAVLRRGLDLLPAETEEAHLRLWYVLGDLAERAGDTSDAIRWFESISTNVSGFHDVDDRLHRLR